MKTSLSDALDESLILLEAGQVTLRECAARYPEHAADLLPLLKIALEVRRVPAPTPDPAAFAAGKRRMLEALAEKKQLRARSFDPFRRCANWLSAAFRRLERTVVRRPQLAFQMAAAALAILIFAVIALSLRPWAGGSINQTATLIQVEGAVDFMPAGGDVWLSASSGVQVEAGARIRTGPLSSAMLVLPEESEIRLMAETEISVVEMRASRDSADISIALYQWLGQTYSRVRPLPTASSEFVIETPTAVAAVRGTEFVVDVEPDGATNVAVVEGLVEVVGQGNAVTVQAGYQTVVRPDRPPAPERPALTLTPLPRTVTQPPTLTDTPQPPTLTDTPRPPTLTDTPQPPAPTHTPQPPGLTNTPQPPGLTNTPQPPGLTNTPQPPGQTKTPQPPGQTKTPQPPGQTKQPGPPERTKKPGPPDK